MGRHEHVQADGNNDHIRSLVCHGVDFARRPSALRDVLSGFVFEELGRAKYMRSGLVGTMPARHQR